MTHDFWSRRKAAVQAENLAEVEAQQAELDAAKQAELEERSDEEILQELDLPDPDTLDDPDRVKEFLVSDVPQRLKTRALRRLWRLNPVLANVDGLVDYGEDFTDSAMVVENMQTVYQVGKGMLARFEEMVADVAEDEAETVDEAEDTASEDVAAETAEPESELNHHLDESPDAAPDMVAANATEMPEEPPLSPITSRRMRFRFEATGRGQI